MTLKKLCANINEDVAREIIVQHHLLEHHTDNASEVVLELDLDTWEQLRKVKNDLKVSLDAVVSGLLSVLIKENRDGKAKNVKVSKRRRNDPKKLLKRRRG